MTLLQVSLPARTWGNVQAAHLLVLMLGPELVTMVVLSQQCAECLPKEYDDLTLTFSQQTP